MSSCCSAPQGSTSTAVKGLSLGHQPHCVISKSCMPSASATHGRQLRQTHHPSEALLTRFISPLGHFLSKDSVVPLIAHARCQATSPLATSPIEVATYVASCSSIVTFEAISRDHLPIGATHIENYQFLYLQVTRNANRVLSHRDPSSSMVTDTRPHQLHMHARVHIPSLSWIKNSISRHHQVGDFKLSAVNTQTHISAGHIDARECPLVQSNAHIFCGSFHVFLRSQLLLRLKWQLFLYQCIHLCYLQLSDRQAFS